MAYGRGVVSAAALTVAALLLCAPRSIVVHAEDRAAFQPAQSAQQQPAAAPTLKVYSRETIVDVTVTDAKGNPVHGLTRSDFTVMEDGKPQPIQSFEEFGRKEVQPPPKLPPNVYTNLQSKAAGSALNILLLDFVNTAPSIALECCECSPNGGPQLCNDDGWPGTLHRGDPDPAHENAGSANLMWAVATQHQVKEEAKRYIERMPAGTRVAVLLMSLPGRLRTLQGVTSQAELLKAAVDTAQFSTGATAINKSTWCTQTDMRNRMTLESLSQIGSDLAAVKGRKNLIWITSGAPAAVNLGALAGCQPDLDSALKTSNILAAAQVAVFPVDAHGVAVPNAWVSPTGHLGVGGGSYQQTAAEEHLGMEALAEATGGAAYYNSNDLTSLIAQAVDKGANYYTLSYVPPGGYNWAHHTIKVVVDKPGLKMVYRESYDAVDPATIKPAPALTLAGATTDSSVPIDMRTEMGRAIPTSQQILFDVQVEPSDEPAKPTDPAVFGVLDVKLKTKPLTRYGFQYAFPGRQIVFKTAADGTRHGSLEFDLAAYDGEGNVVTSLRQAIQLSLTAEQVAQLAHSPFRYFEQLDLPAGALFVRVGVLDRTANKVGTLEIPVTVAKTPAQSAAVGAR